MTAKSNPNFLRKQEAILKRLEANAEGEPAVIEEEEGIVTAIPIEDEDKLELDDEQPEGLVDDSTLGDDETVIPDEVKDPEGDTVKLEPNTVNDDTVKGEYELENKKLNDTVTNQATLIATMQKQLAEITKPGAEPTKIDDKLLVKINEDDLDGFDPKVVDIIKTVNAQVDVIKSLASNVDTVGSTVKESSVNGFWGTVRNTVSDFDKINGVNGAGADPKWGEYLDEIDPVFNMTRREAAKAAITNQNSNHLVSMVNDFKKVKGYTGTTSETSSGKKGKDKLSQQILPNLSNNNKDTGKKSGNMTVTKAQYQKATKDRQHRRMSEKRFAEISEAYQKTVMGQG